jgi:syntaxin 1B/2/3
MRHYKITSEEVPTSHLETGNGLIFANHLLEVDKHSTHALSNVTNRYNGIQNINANVYTLSRLFGEMSEVVGEQEEPIRALELNSEQTAKQVEQGNTKATKAIKHIRLRNSKK